MRDKVKAHYIEKLKTFFDDIKDIPAEHIKTFPSIHIPQIGAGYEKTDKKIAFFGIETYNFGLLPELKKDFEDNPDKGYDYLTNSLEPKELVGWSNKTTFFRYIAEVLAAVHGIPTSEFKTAENFEKYPFIWGNIKSWEGAKITSKTPADKKSNIDKIHRASKVFNWSDTGHLGPGDIIKLTQPDVVFIMNWDFNFQEWTKAEFGENVKVKAKEVADHLWYSKVEDTHIYKQPHPTFIQRSKTLDKQTFIAEILNNMNQK